MKWHPDKNNGSTEAAEKFKEISEAYAILSNPDRKKRYDMFGDTGQGDDMDDVFSEFFSGGMGGFSFSMSGDDMDDFMDFLE